MRRFRSFGTVAAVEANTRLSGGLYTQPEEWMLTGELNSDDALEQAVQPSSSGSAVQILDIEFWAGGVLLASYNRIGEFSVEMDYDNLLQGGAIKLPLENGEGLYGGPFGCLGPGIGKTEIDVKGLYVVNGQLYRFPILTRGIVDTAPRESGEDGIYEDIVFVDEAGRYDGRKITVQFPPGHGLRRDRVGMEVMKRIGDPNVAFEQCEVMNKELQLIDTEPLATLAEIFEVENRRLYKDSAGYWINPRVGRPRDDEPDAFTFEEKDFVRAAVVRLEPQQNVITLVIANGSQQNVEEQGPCLTRTELIVKYRYETNYTVKKSAYRQNTDGTYTPITPNASVPAPVLVEKVETYRKYLCEVLVEERIKTWQMARRQRTRHKWNGSAWVSLLCYTDDNDPVGIGKGPAYVDINESLRLVKVSHYFAKYLHASFIADGLFSGPFDWQLVLNSPNMTVEQALGINNGTFQQTAFYGQAQGGVTFTSQLGHIRGAIKSRDNDSDIWEDVNPPSNKEIWGDYTGYTAITNPYSFEGFIFPEEALAPSNIDALIPWGISVTGFEGNDQQQQTSEETLGVSYRAPRGNLHYFGDNDSRDDTIERFQTTDRSYTTYSVTGTTHSETTVTQDVITGDSKENTTRGLPGGLPAIERLDFVEPNSDIYEAGEQTTTDEETGELIPGVDKKAQRGDTTQIQVTVPFDFFLTCHLPKEVVVDFPWAENQDELRKMCEALAQESAAMPFFFTLPGNLLIRPSQVIRATYRLLNSQISNRRCRVKRVRISRTADSPLLTSCECRMYPF